MLLGSTPRQSDGGSGPLAVSSARGDRRSDRRDVGARCWGCLRRLALVTDITVSLPRENYNNSPPSSRNLILGRVLAGPRPSLFSRGRTHARNPTASPAVAQCLLRRGGLGPTVRAVLMRTTCVGGAPRICDTSLLGISGPQIVEIQRIQREAD